VWIIASFESLDSLSIDMTWGSVGSLLCHTLINMAVIESKFLSFKKTGMTRSATFYIFYGISSSSSIKLFRHGYYVSPKILVTGVRASFVSCSCALLMSLSTSAISSAKSRSDLSFLFISWASKYSFGVLTTRLFVRKPNSPSGDFIIYSITIMNRKGGRTSPWKTPVVIGKALDSCHSKNTWLVELSYSTRVASTNIIFRSTESKAFLKSINMMKNGMFCVCAPSIILLKMWICWIQLRPDLKPAWFILSNRSMGSRIRLNKTRLYTLAAIDIRLIPMYFVMSFKSPFFNNQTRCLLDCRLVFFVNQFNDIEQLVYRGLSANF
jgi:hypothetical protein